MLKNCKIRNLLLLAMLAIVLPLSLLSTGVNFQMRKQHELLHIDKELFTAAVMARATLPDNFHDRIIDKDSVSPEEFARIVSRNNRVCEELGMEYLWSLMLIDGVPVFTSSTSPDKKEENGLHAAFFEPHSNPELYEHAFETMQPQYKDNVDKWGRIRAVLVPYMDVQGRKYLFGASKKLADIEALTPILLRQALITMIAFLLPAILVSLALSRRFTRPISRLAEAATAMRQGDLQTEIKIGGSREISVVSDNLDLMRVAFANHVEMLTDALRELQEFEEIVNNSPMIVFNLDVKNDFSTLFISENISVSGYSAKDLTNGKVNWDQLMPEKALERLYENFDQAVADGKTNYQTNTQLIWKSGEVREHNNWYRIQNDETGQPSRLQGMSIDITERVRATEREAQYLEQLNISLNELQAFENVVNNSPVIVYRLRYIPGDWPVEFISESIRLLGYTSGEFLSGKTTWLDLNHAEDHEHLRTFISGKVKQGAETFNTEIRVLTKDGQVRWMHSWNRFIRNEAGEVTHVHGIFTDVTDQKLVQQRMAEIIKIVNSSPLYLFSLRLDDDFTCEFISKNIKRTGYPASAFTSGPVDWGKMIPAEDLELGANAIAATIAAGGDSYTIDTRMVWANGEQHWHRNWNRIIRDEHGTPTHIQGLLADITEEKNAQERDIQYKNRLKALSQDLIQAEDTERRQLAIALHDDIGQMLAALNMKFSVLKETGDRKRINDLVEQVETLLERIMQTCKSLTWEISPTSLYESDIAAGLKRLADDVGRLFNAEVSVEPPQTRIELRREASALLFRCAKELLVNCAKHSGTHSATVAVVPRQGAVRLTVSDTGSGFDAAELENGMKSGFGLFSIKERLLHINGKFTIDSAPGRGTTVTIEIPV